MVRLNPSSPAEGVNDHGVRWLAGVPGVPEAVPILDETVPGLNCFALNAEAISLPEPVDMGMYAIDGAGSSGRGRLVERIQRWEPRRRSGQPGVDQAGRQRGGGGPRRGRGVLMPCAVNSVGALTPPTGIAAVPVTPVVTVDSVVGAARTCTLPGPGVCHVPCQESL